MSGPVGPTLGEILADLPKSRCEVCGDWFVDGAGDLRVLCDACVECKAAYAAAIAQAIHEARQRAGKLSDWQARCSVLHFLRVCEERGLEPHTVAAAWAE